MRFNQFRGSGVVADSPGTDLDVSGATDCSPADWLCAILTCSAPAAYADHPDPEETGSRTDLFENAALRSRSMARVAWWAPTAREKSTLFSPIRKVDVRTPRLIERDEWTTVGFLPQEAEAVGDETVLDVATGRRELLRLERRLHELGLATCRAPNTLRRMPNDAPQRSRGRGPRQRRCRGLGYREATSPARPGK